MLVRHGARHAVNRLMGTLETSRKEVWAGHFHVHGDPTPSSARAHWVGAQVGEGHLGDGPFTTPRIRSRSGVHAEVKGLVRIVGILYALPPFKSTVQEDQHNERARDGNAASGQRLCVGASVRARARTRHPMQWPMSRSSTHSRAFGRWTNWLPFPYTRWCHWTLTNSASPPAFSLRGAWPLARAP